MKLEDRVINKYVKKIFFYLVMTMIPIVFLSLGIQFVRLRMKPPASDYEKKLAGLGEIIDLRARAPYVMFRPRPGTGGMNSMGLWSPELPKEKGPDEFRIAVLGGSVVFSASFPETRLAAQLAELLKERVPKLKDKHVTYINAGVSSYVSGQELALLVYHLLPLHIDLLVIFDGFNDFFCPFGGYERRPGYPFDYIVEEYRYYKFYGEKGWWATFFSLFDPVLIGGFPKKVVEDYYKALGIPEIPFEELPPQIIDIYFENISKISQIARAYGIQSAIFLQPYNPNHYAPTRHEAIYLRQLYAMARERYKTLAPSNTPNQIFYDLSTMAEELQDLFTDVAHFKDEPGNRLVAERMYQIMEKEGMLN